MRRRLMFVELDDSLHLTAFVVLLAVPTVVIRVWNGWWDGCETASLLGERGGGGATPLHCLDPTIGISDVNR